jgi:hypothetical protein
MKALLEGRLPKLEEQRFKRASRPGRQLILSTPVVCDLISSAIRGDR